LLDGPLPTLHIPELWDLGLRGSGVHVGVVGTGIDLAHPDFADGKVSALSLYGHDVQDEIGHETGVTWVIHRIAPEARITVVKVQANKNGLLSDVIEGCELLRRRNVEIINLSMSSQDAARADHPICLEANFLVLKGIMVVAAAGNWGPWSKTIGAPGAATLALTVGKVDRHNFVTRDSSRGPTLDGPPKPDCVAPGVEVIAAVPLRLRSNYGLYDCTSIAAPHVTGIAALLKGEYPHITPAKLKLAITASCTPVTSLFGFHPNPNVCGAGLVNALRAYEWTKKHVEN
jgi:subtilisin family serine protease